MAWSVLRISLHAIAGVCSLISLRLSLQSLVSPFIYAISERSGSLSLRKALPACYKRKSLMAMSRQDLLLHQHM